MFNNDLIARDMCNFAVKIDRLSGGVREKERKLNLLLSNYDYDQ